MDVIARLESEIAELEALMEKYRHDRSPKAEFGLRLVRHEADRRRSQLEALRRDSAAS